MADASVGFPSVVHNGPQSQFMGARGHSYTGREYRYIHSSGSFFLQIHKDGEIDTTTHYDTAAGHMKVQEYTTTNYPFLRKQVKMASISSGQKCATDDCIFRKELADCDLFTIFTAFHGKGSKPQYLVMNRYGTVRLRRRNPQSAKLTDCRKEIPDFPWLFFIRQPPLGSSKSRTTPDVNPRWCKGVRNERVRSLTLRKVNKRRRLCRRRLRLGRRRLRHRDGLCRRRSFKGPSLANV